MWIACLWAAVVLGATGTEPREDLREARLGFVTNLVRHDHQNRPFPEAPPEWFTRVDYSAPSGPTAAYLTPPPDHDELVPAIVWLTGGFPTARGGAYVWTPGQRDNEQSASAYRDAGVAMMFPTVRGTNQNPGFQEAYFGEVDDVIAAGEFLSNVEFVDPEQVYLGGHSTGATLALLVAECSDLFRAVFCFGPVAEIGNGFAFDPTDPQERHLRSPVHFLDGIGVPTYVVEGNFGNRGALLALREANHNPFVHFALVPGANHFEPLAPANEFLAQRILKHRESEFSLDAQELIDVYERDRVTRQEGLDRARFETLDRAWREARPPAVLRFTIRSESEEVLLSMLDAEFLTEAWSHQHQTMGEHPDTPHAREIYVLELRTTIRLDPRNLARSSGNVAVAARHLGLEYVGWEVVSIAR